MRTNDSTNTASTQVPFMVTMAMRQNLKTLGLTDAEIDKMKPSEAWQILGGLPDMVAASAVLTLAEAQRAYLTWLETKSMDELQSLWHGEESRLDELNEYAAPENAGHITADELQAMQAEFDRHHWQLGAIAKVLEEHRVRNDGHDTPAAPLQQNNSDSRPRSLTARELLDSELPPLRPLVQDLIIRPGLTVLGGQPKVGKSWLSLQIARAVALDLDVLARRVLQPGRVLYYALEDGRARLQARIRQVGWTGDEDVLFFFGDALPPLDAGGVKALEKDVRAQAPVLVVIDSLAAGKTGRLDENDGGKVAELMYALSRLSATYDLSLLVVHHHRKTTTGSPIADLRGSSALGGAADAILALYRERGVAECKLGLDSRDSEGGDWTIGFTGSGWTFLGGAEIVDQKQTERKTVKALQGLGADGGTAEQVIEAAGGMRRQDAYAALKSLEASGLIESEDTPQDGKGKARRVYKIKVP